MEVNNVDEACAYIKVLVFLVLILFIIVFILACKISTLNNKIDTNDFNFRVLKDNYDSFYQSNMRLGAICQSLHEVCREVLAYNSHLCDKINDYISPSSTGEKP